MDGPLERPFPGDGGMETGSLTLSCQTLCCESLQALGGGEPATGDTGMRKAGFRMEGPGPPLTPAHSRGSQLSPCGS